MKIVINTPEEFFGTLLESVTSAWRKHLKTSSYSKHMALNEFYEEAPEKIDALVEAYQGAKKHKIDEYVNVLKDEAPNMDALEYLETLVDILKDGRSQFLEGDEGLESLVDDLIGFTQGIIYKIRELKESRYTSLRDFIAESLQDDEE